MDIYLCTEIQMPGHKKSLVLRENVNVSLVYMSGFRNFMSFLSIMYFPAYIKTDGGYTAFFYDKLRWSWAELRSPGSMSVLAV